jgi:hypothetical protein
MPTTPLTGIPSAEEIHAALVKALEEARDAILAARQARRRVEVAQAIDHRIEVVRLARSHNMPIDEIALHLGISASYVQKMGQPGPAVAGAQA